jgi:hypothetical protein
MSASNQSSSKKRGCLKWGGVALGALVLLLIVVLAIVGFQGSRAKAALRAQYPPPGQMVDVGGLLHDLGPSPTRGGSDHAGLRVRLRGLWLE